MQDLSLVIATRHGEYNDKDGTLDKQGISEVTILANRLKSLVPHGQNIRLVTSPLTRAVQSAEIVGSALQVTPEVHDVLKVDDYSCGAAIMRELAQSCGDAGVIIAVTHYDSPAGIINAVLKDKFGRQFQRIVCPKANGHMLNMASGEVTAKIV